MCITGRPTHKRAANTDNILAKVEMMVEKGIQDTTQQTCGLVYLHDAESSLSN